MVAELSTNEPEDLLALVEQARALMAARYVRDKHHIGAVVRTRSGQVFEGIHVEAGNGRISDYGPRARVILEDDGVLKAVPVAELLPVKYDGSKYPNRREG